MLCILLSLKAVKRFSRWPKYVAWTIVVVSSVVSSFFVIMYSLDWGREKSEAWLKAFFLSFCLTSVVAETGQILLLALLAAWICNTTPSSKQRTYEIKKDELHLHLLERKAPEKVHSPGAASVQRMKRKNEQRRKFHIVLREYTILFLLVVVLFFISQQDKDPFAFNASQTLSSTLTKGFNSITTPGDFWAWSEKIFLPVLYPSSWYNGWKMKYLDRQFPLHTQAFRIGPPRFIQIRDTADSVELDDTPNGWFVFTGNGSYPCWQFNATSTLVFDSDCISKHSMELPTTLAQATSTLSDLQRTQWIDQYTKWLVLELSLYYPSRKLFSSLQMTVHKTNIGHLSTSATVRTYRLFQYENTSDYGVMIAHIIFIVFFLANLIMEAMVIKEEGMKYFFSIWNLISFVSIIGSAVLIWAFGMRYHFASEALKKIVEATG
ncbi:polycystin family receptor for egg jelly-like [Branchiostoma floridae x Branchiostoma japonicum]